MTDYLDKHKRKGIPNRRHRLLWLVLPVILIGLGLLAHSLQIVFAEHDDIPNCQFTETLMLTNGELNALDTQYLLDNNADDYLPSGYSWNWYEAGSILRILNSNDEVIHEIKDLPFFGGTYWSPSQHYLVYITHSVNYWADAFLIFDIERAQIIDYGLPTRDRWPVSWSPDSRYLLLLYTGLYEDENGTLTNRTLWTIAEPQAIDPDLAYLSLGWRETAYEDIFLNWSHTHDAVYAVRGNKIVKYYVDQSIEILPIQLPYEYHLGTVYINSLFTDRIVIFSSEYPTIFADLVSGYVSEISLTWDDRKSSEMSPTGRYVRYSDGQNTSVYEFDTGETISQTDLVEIVDTVWLYADGEDYLLIKPSSVDVSTKDTLFAWQPTNNSYCRLETIVSNKDYQ